MPGYDVIDELGRGGMGVVYRARHLALGRVVALKLMLAANHAGAAARTRFRVESQAAARLQHPNIVQVFEVGEADAGPYFSQEFVPGGSLAQKLTVAPLAPRQAAELVAALARAVQFAHDAGVVHRDLKPANILLAADGTPKIGDLGLAKVVEQDAGLTASGGVLGTPSYMAPEQAGGDPQAVGPAADVYALGAILYDALTGRPPFKGTSVLDTLELLRTRDPLPPRRLQPKTPKDLETICLKCLQKEPAKRYASAAELADDLGRYLDGRPILARPVGPVEHFTRWCRRSPVQAGLAVSTAVLAVVLVAGGIAYAANLRDKNRQIENQNAALARERDEVNRKNAVIEEQNTALSRERDEVRAQAESNAGKIRFLLRNTAADLKLLGLARQREALVEFVMQDLKRIEGLTGDNSGVDDRARLGVYMNLAELYFDAAVAATGEKRTEQLQKSADAYSKAVALGEKVAAARPTSDLAQGNLALTLAARGGFLLQIGKPAEATRDLERAFRLRKAIAETPQSPPGTRDHLFPADRLSSLAESYQSLCNLPEVAADKGRFAECLTKAIALSESALKMVEADAKTTEEPTGAVAFRRRLGSAYAFAARRGPPTDARGHYEKARQVREKVTAEVPDSLPDRAALAETVGKLGDLALFADDPKTAAKLYEEMLVHLGKTVSPTDTRRQWGMAYYRVATAQLMAGDAKAALATYRKCLAVWDDLAKDSTSARDHWGLMVALARCGEHERAAAVVADVGQKFPQVPDYFYNAACTYSICAGGVGDGVPDDKLTAEQLAARTDYLTKAWAMLGKVFEAKSRKAAEIPTDPDLVFLRGRPDYKEKLAVAQKGGK